MRDEPKKSFWIRVISPPIGSSSMESWAHRCGRTRSQVCGWTAEKRMSFDLWRHLST